MNSHTLTSIIKNFNQEIHDLLKYKETKEILFERGIPCLPTYFLYFDKELSLSKDKRFIYIGSLGLDDICIDLKNREAIITFGVVCMEVVNTSLSKLVQFIHIFTECFSKLSEEPEHKSELIYELDSKLRSVDKEAYLSTFNFWHECVMALRKNC